MPKVEKIEAFVETGREKLLVKQAVYVKDGKKYIKTYSGRRVNVVNTGRRANVYSWKGRSKRTKVTLPIYRRKKRK